MLTYFMICKKQQTFNQILNYLFFCCRINDHSPVALQFIHQIKKRSTCPCSSQEIIEKDQCLRTLVQYKKYDCKRFGNGQSQK